MIPAVPDEEPPVQPARYVRPYTITAGRTRATVDLPLEATLAREHGDAEGRGAESPVPALTVPARQVLETCHGRSVAEVSALVSMPLGVVRVLLSDLVEQGLVRVQATLTETSSRDERIELIERTLRGLRTY